MHDGSAGRTPAKPLPPKAAARAQAIWVLTGPTASGKSALAEHLAVQMAGEIISCDSVQIYRGFDVGSAKPSAAAQRRVRYHLLDLVAPEQAQTAAFDAMQFVRAATRAAADIFARGRQPILCGGTGLYLGALRHGLIDVPSDAALKTQLLAEAKASPALCHRRLAALDAASAQQIHPKNTAHVVRALEICLLTGRPASAVRAEQAARAAGAQAPPLRVLALDGDNDWLRARIVQRTEQMLAAGWVTEVRGLLDRGVPPTCLPMRSVGYREVVACLTGRLPAAQLAQEIVRSTWAYVRRQRTWLRRSPPDAWLRQEAMAGGVPERQARQFFAG